MEEGKKKYWVAMLNMYLYADTEKEAFLQYKLMLKEWGLDSLIVVREVKDGGG